jgi:hypothetical protein
MERQGMTWHDKAWKDMDWKGNDMAWKGKTTNLTSKLLLGASRIIDFFDLLWSYR